MLTIADFLITGLLYAHSFQKLPVSSLFRKKHKSDNFLLLGASRV